MNAEYSVHRPATKVYSYLVYSYNTLLNNINFVIVLISFVHPASTD